MRVSLPKPPATSVMITALLMECSSVGIASSKPGFAPVKCRIEWRRMCRKHARDGCGDFMKANRNGRLVRAIIPAGPPLRMRLDGAEVTAHAGDSVLVAVLTVQGALRRHEFS